MNTMVKLPDSRWPGWRRRLYWWMHEAVEAEEVISLDLETTSLDPRRADILSIGAVLVRRGKLVMGERLELYVEPPPSLDAESIRIHKLRRADLEGQLQLEQALRQLLAFIGDRPLRLLSFDVAVLNRHLRQLFDRQLHNPSIEISSLYHRKVSRHFPDAHRPALRHPGAGPGCAGQRSPYRPRRRPGGGADVHAPAQGPAPKVIH